MRALITKQINAIENKIGQKPVPKENEVLVKVMAAGLCGSDSHILHGKYPATYPLIQGHEFSGIIQETGSMAAGWSVGQRVTVDPNIYCNHCIHCLKNQKNMCSNAQAIGVTRAGAFAEYIAVPVSQLYELPENISFNEGALIEPLACAIYGVQRLGFGTGSRAIVFGAGPMGLLLIQTLRTCGAGEIVAYDSNASRLAMAIESGAVRTYQEFTSLKEDHPTGFDVVIDAVGHPEIIEKMFLVAAKKAKILQFGCAPNDSTVCINPFALYDNEWEYIGSKTSVYNFHQALEMVSSGRYDLSSIISETVSLERLVFYLKNGKPENSLKVIADPTLK